MRVDLPCRVRTLATTTTALALCASGCGDVVAPAYALREQFTGRVEQSDVAVAVVRDGANVVAYVCGGASTLESHTAWYQGEMQGDRAVLRGPRGELAVAFDGDAVTGTSGALSFRIARTSALGGLYEHRGACRTGVIVFSGANGDFAAQGAGCDANGRRSQVTPIRPMELLADGLAVVVDRDPSHTLFVRPVSIGR